MAEPVCIVDCRNVLGEGPCWDAETARLYWFDIKRAELFWWDGEASGLIRLPARSSAAAVRLMGGLVIASEAGLLAVDPLLGAAEVLEAMPAVDPGFRSNDGRIDQNGRFWWSVMDDDGGRRPGFVMRRDPGGVSARVVDDIHIANSLASSPDGRTLYLADTARQTIFAYPMDPDTGALGERRVFAETRGTDAFPDGTAVDRDGYLWNAQWGAWRIVRYAPDGTVERTIDMPVEQPSSCTFGGPDLDILFVTSAREALTEVQLGEQPQAGGVFAFEPGVQGLALPLFAG